MPEHLGRDRHDAVRREQRAQDVRVAERIGSGQLREHAGGHAQVEPDRKDVARARAAARAEDELVLGEHLREHADQRIHHPAAGIQDGAAAELDHVRVRQHADHGRLRSSRVAFWNRDGDAGGQCQSGD